MIYWNDCMAKQSVVGQWLCQPAHTAGLVGRQHVVVCIVTLPQGISLYWHRCTLNLCSVCSSKTTSIKTSFLQQRTVRLKGPGVTERINGQDGRARFTVINYGSTPPLPYLKLRPKPHPPFNQLSHIEPSQTPNMVMASSSRGTLNKLLVANVTRGDRGAVDFPKLITSRYIIFLKCHQSYHCFPLRNTHVVTSVDLYRSCDCINKGIT